MKNQKFVLDMMRAQGKMDALDLRTRAAELDGTGIIAEEGKVPAFDPEKDYTGWPAGAPVWDEVEGERQVFTLLQPHNASHYPDTTPAMLPALWSICHTKDPNRAKPYLAPNGLSGMYMADECCTDAGRIWRSKIDNNVQAPSSHPDDWDDLGYTPE